MKNIDLILNSRPEDFESYINYCLQKYNDSHFKSFYLQLLIMLLKKARKRKGALTEFTLQRLPKELADFFIKTKKGGRNVVFIDHSYHAKTMSSMFFVNKLQGHFNVDVLWSKAWQGLPENNIKAVSDYIGDESILLYWQVFPSTEIKHSRTIIVPMWDGVSEWSDAQWKPYRYCRFISFSLKLHRRLIQMGFMSFYLKEYPQVDFYIGDIEAKKKPIIYFWPRTSEIDWRHFRRKIKADQVAGIILKVDPDPGQNITYPSPMDVEAYNVKFSQWCENKKEHLKELECVDIYVAPRKREGIGFSYLDAMSKGCVVIAEDESTMNEYIDNDIGYLVNFGSSKAVDLSRWQEKMRNLYYHLVKHNNSKKNSDEELFQYIEGCLE